MRAVIRAYLFALDPTEAQADAFRSHCGAQRFAYNFGLALVRVNLDQRAAERSYDIGEDQLTPPVSWSAYSLRRAWNEAKNQRAPRWAQNSKEAYSGGLANLATALSNWSSSKSAKRAGPTVRFPRFKGRRARLSCRFTTGAFGLGPDRRHIQLPRIGLVRTHESTRRLARKVEAGIARIRSATLSCQRGRWHVAFSVELPDPTPPVRTGGRVWQSWKDGVEVLNPHQVRMSQRGDTVEIVAVTRGTPFEDGGYMWRGELRLWDNGSSWAATPQTRVPCGRRERCTSCSTSTAST